MNCKLSSVRFRAKQKEYAKLDTVDLEESFTFPFDGEDLLIYENGLLTIDTDEAEPGNLNFLLMFKQRDNNTAFIEFEIIFEEKPIEEPAVVFQVIIEEEVEEVVEEEVIEEVVEEVIEEIVEEPEPEVESVQPLSDDELEEAKSAAPKTGSDGAVSIGPWRPPWQNKASAADAAAALSAMPKVEPVEEEVPPVEIVVSSMNREGKVEMEFNQDLVVPEFASGRRLLSADGRILLSLGDIDVARDIVDIKFKSLSENSNFALYTLELVRWDARGIEIFVNFTDPLSVSTGQQRDTLEFTIRNPEQFIS